MHMYCILELTSITTVSTVVWQTMSQFSRRTRRGTQENTDLSVSLQCLAKLWRILFGEVLKKTCEGQCTGHSQYSFMTGKSCLSNLISSHDKVTHLADQEKAVDDIFLDFIGLFDPVSQDPSRQNVQHTAEYLLYINFFYSEDLHHLMPHQDYSRPGVS